MSRILEALRRIEARRLSPESPPEETSPPAGGGKLEGTAAEAALEWAEAVTVSAAAAWDAPTPHRPGKDLDRPSVTIVPPVLPDCRPEAFLVPPDPVYLEWQPPDAAGSEVARPGDGVVAGDATTRDGTAPDPSPESAGRRSGAPAAVSPDEPAPAYRRLAEQVLRKVPAGAGAVLMFTSPLDTRDTAQLLERLAPALSLRAEGREPLLLDAGIADPACRLDELRRSGRMVLIGAGPLSEPETAPLSRCCDGVYLVVRPAETPARVLRDAARAIRARDGRLLGTIVVHT